MADGNLGQDDIDRMLAELGADDGAKPTQPADVSPPPVAPTPEAPPTMAETQATAEAGPLDQDAIDALIAQTAQAVSEPARPTTSSSHHLDQGEIDKLLAELDPQTRSKSKASATEHLSQKDIDRLLNELDVTPAGSSGGEPVPATLRSAKASAPALSNAQPPVEAVPASAASATAEGPLSQDDIDRLLAELGAPSKSVGAQAKPEATPAPAPAPRRIPPAPEPVEAAPGLSADATQALSPDEIDAIVARQSADAPPGSESEAVIAQSDIDALVKQLAQATGAPEAQEIVDAIAGKAADIDALQAEQPGDFSPEHTRDAVDVNSVLGRTASTASLHQPAPMQPQVATIATFEWRWASGLLIAAVLLLTVCSGALIVLTMSVAGLSQELRTAREVERPAADGYADKLRLALAKLGEADDAEQARGVRWMDELKRQHPDHAADVGISLARHFRAREAWRRAADEYGAALETAVAVDDPRIWLEHADCLSRLGDTAGAIRQVYILLAAEAHWLAERDVDGRPAASLDRNRQAIANAYLTLGRLLARSQGPAVAGGGGP